MKLLLDQGVARSAVIHLAALGHDAVHVGEIGLATALDKDILELARREERVLVTLDADFHALLALQVADEPSVVRLRVQGLGAAPIAALIAQIVDACAADLEAGAVITSDGKRIRVRRLPIR